MKRTIPFMIFVLMIALVSTILVWSQTNTQLQNATQSNQNSEYTSDKQRVESLTSARDLEGLLQLSSIFQKKWAENIAVKARLQLLIISSLSSYDFKDNQQYIYTVKLSKEVLKEADRIPIQIEYELVSKLQSTSAYSNNLTSKDQLELDRLDRVKYLLHLWNRVQRDYDRNFLTEVSNRPVTNVTVPAPNYMPGINPSDIRDPVVKGKYIDAIEVNKEKAIKYNLQLQLQKLDQILPSFIEKFIIDLYSQSPFKESELEQIFADFKIENEKKSQILRSIKAGF